MKNLKKILCFAFPVAVVMALVLGLMFMKTGANSQTAEALGSVYVGKSATCAISGGTISGDIDVYGGTLTLTGGTIKGNINLNGTMNLSSGATVNGTVNYQNTSSYITLTSSLTRTITVKPFSTASGTRIAYAASASYLNTSRFSVVGLGSNQMLVIVGRYIQIASQEYYNVLISADQGGRVSQSSITNVLSGTPIAKSGNTIMIAGTTVTATPDDGYVFVRWDISPSYAAVTENTIIRAVFRAYIPGEDAFDLGVVNNIISRGYIIVGLDTNRSLYDDEKIILSGFADAILHGRGPEELDANSYVGYYDEFVTVEYAFTDIDDINDCISSGEFDFYFPNAIADGAGKGASTWGFPWVSDVGYGDFGSRAEDNPLKLTMSLDSFYEYYVFSSTGASSIEELADSGLPTFIISYSPAWVFSKDGYDRVMEFLGSCNMSVTNNYYVDGGADVVQNIVDNIISTYGTDFILITSQDVLEVGVNGLINAVAAAGLTMGCNLLSNISSYDPRGGYLFMYTDNYYFEGPGDNGAGGYYMQDIADALGKFFYNRKKYIYEALLNANHGCVYPEYDEPV